MNANVLCRSLMPVSTMAKSAPHFAAIGAISNGEIVLIRS